ncbi:hypothetical protein [uncultured Planktosalinus sp.]|uniref:hypothetical protein n=1 Tax=uncultured Planktosalinus sp. TaxID=1810935 RepID=UPI0030DAA498
MSFKIFVYSLFSIMLFSCQNNENKFELERKIEDDIKKTFQELGVKIRDTVFIDKDVLNVSMTQDSGYFIDDASNHLLRSYYLFKHYDELKKMDSIYISVSFKHLTDRKTFSYGREGVDMIYAKLSDNPLFLSLVPYVARNIDANDLVYMDNIINEMPEYVSKERYNYTGTGFWDFVYDYTNHCCDSETFMHKNMDEVYHSSKYPDFPVRPDIFEYIINACKGYCR